MKEAWLELCHSAWIVGPSMLLLKVKFWQVSSQFLSVLHLVNVFLFTWILFNPNIKLVIFRLSGKLMMENAEHVETHGMAKGEWGSKWQICNRNNCGHLYLPVNTYMLRSKLQPTQLSNLWWMPNSVRIGFGPATKTGSSKRFKRYPTTWFILIHSKGKPTWNSHIGCGVSFESSWWARFHGRVKTFPYWVWHSS